MDYKKGKILSRRIVIALLLSVVMILPFAAPVPADVPQPENWTEPVPNPVLSANVSPEIWNGANIVAIGASSVIWDASVSKYKMWYTGVDDSDNGTLRIGYAYSDDGTSWTKYAGNPVLSPTIGFEAGSVGSPCVIKVGTNSYKMWYTASDISNNRSIGYASSTDGISWTSRQQVTGLGGQSWEAGGVGSPSVVIVGSEYRMWYSGKTASQMLLGEQAIGYATSSNGITWTPFASNPVLLKQGADWESYGVAVAGVIKLGSTNQYRMLYTGYAFNGNQYTSKLGYATSTNGTGWTRSLANPVINVGGDHEWDELGAGAASLYWDYSKYRLWYGGVSESNLTVSEGYAEMKLDLTGQFLLQGAQRPASGQAVPLTIELFTPGTDVWSSTPVATCNVTAIDTGISVGGVSFRDYFEFPQNVTPGTYDVTISSPHTLMNVKRNVDMTTLPLATSLNIGTLYEGNCNDDQQVNSLDFSILADTYGRSTGNLGWDERADFDRNGQVDAVDFSLLAANYFIYYAPVEV